MKTQLAWKVVRQDENRGCLMSAAASFRTRLIYSIKKWTIPHKNGNKFLFVFKTRKSARSYLKHWNGNLNFKFKLFRCEVKNLKNYAIDMNGNLIKNYVFLFPEGTMFCDKVKLIKKSS